MNKTNRNILICDSETAKAHGYGKNSYYATSSVTKSIPQDKEFFFFWLTLQRYLGNGNGILGMTGNQQHYSPSHRPHSSQPFHDFAWDNSWKSLEPWKGTAAGTASEVIPTTVGRTLDGGFVNSAVKLYPDQASNISISGRIRQWIPLHSQPSGERHHRLAATATAADADARCIHTLRSRRLCE